MEFEKTEKMIELEWWASEAYGRWLMYQAAWQEIQKRIEKEGKEMTIKMGSNHTTVFNTVNMMVDKKGMTVRDAIIEVEKILRCQLPEEIKSRIYQECG